METRARPARTGCSTSTTCAAKVDERTALVARHAGQQRDRRRPAAWPRSSRLAHARGALVHCDAVQAAGKIPVDVRALGVDTAGPLRAQDLRPKGVGALYVRRGTRLKPLLRGGSQERNRRAGTENVAGIVGLGRAAALARERAGRGAPRGWRRCATGWRSGCLAIPGARRNGDGPRVPNTSNVSFEGVEAESLLMALDLRASPSPPAPPAPRARSSRRTCCAAWACRSSACRARCASRWAARHHAPAQVDRAAEAVAAAVERSAADSRQAVRTGRAHRRASGRRRAGYAACAR